MYLVTAGEMQTMDRQTIEGWGIPGRVLMENAGRGATRVFFKAFGDLLPAKVGIVAGRGNNGGDGFVMARYLAQRGIPTTIYLLARRGAVQGDAAANLNLLDGLRVPIVEIPDQQALETQRLAMHHQKIWIDAILGTGLKSDVRGYYRTVIETINQFNRPVLAVDIPSGLNADNGQVCGVCLRATVTVTFGLAKLGHQLYPGVDYIGDLHIIDIGIPDFVVEKVAPRQFLLTPAMVKAGLPTRPADTHKGRTGHLLVIAGATGKSGAGAMTAMAAMRAGAGLVTLGVPSSLNPGMEIQVLEAMTEPLPEEKDGCLGASAFDPIMALLDGKKALALGPGIGTAASTCQLVHRLLAECPLPIVLDADGLNCLAQDLTSLKRLQAPLVLTPHPGEMARLLGASTQTVQQDRVQAARQLASDYAVHLVLKGARTVTAHPDGRVFINPTGNAGMASGGMGDVLTGLIAGLIVQGAAPESAARAGVYLHGAAADTLAAQNGPIGFLASEVLKALPQTMQRLTANALPSSQSEL
jgi:NAD(P)H-hydrate epimerase